MQELIVLDLHRVAPTRGGLPTPLYDAACRALAEARAIDEVKTIRNQAEAMRHYAKQAKNRQLEMDGVELRLRAERRLGELFEAQRQSVGLAKGGRPHQRTATGSRTDPVAAPTLNEVGIDKHLADRSRKLAALSKEIFQDKLAELRERALSGERIGLDILKPPKQRGTGEFEWYTPADWLDRARKVLGAFDLDPATSLVAQRTVKAKRFYTLDDDGLTKQWRGRVWMNPPYAQPAIQHFADKLVDEFEAGHVTAAIALTNDCTDTQWFHRLARAALHV